MKKTSTKRIIAYVLGIAILASATAYSALKLGDQFESGTANAETCREKGASHVISISDNQMTPDHIEGKLCDTLTVKNNDNVLRFMAFGQHDEHKPYDGITQKNLDQGQEFTVTLNQTGSYIVHDHLHDEVKGTFRVSR